MRTQPRITLRAADASHAKRIHALIAGTAEEGRLLPRTLDEVTRHAERFVIAMRGRAIVGCAELAPLSAQVAEVRSLAVDPKVRQLGIGERLVDEVRARARAAGFERFTAFTHVPGYFSRMGFSIVPHVWIAEKIRTDCVSCPLFRTCGKYAMLVMLDDHKEQTVHDAAAAHHP